MLDILSIVLPFFGLIAVGYAGALSGLAKPPMIDGLAEFLFIFCLPVMMFKLVSGSPPLDVLPLGYWASYYIGMVTIWIVSAAAAAYLFKCNSGETVIAGLSAGQANAVVFATPLIIKIYGEAAGFPVAMLIAVNLPITTTIASVLLERSRGAGGVALRPLLKSLTTHPILLGIFAGIVAKSFGVQATGTLGSIVDALAGIALPASLVSLGMATQRYGILGDIRPALTVTFLRLLVHPAITYVLAVYVFNLPPIWTGAAVLFASAPAGINAYLFAARYGEGQRIASSAVTISTAASTASILLWMWVLR